MPVSVLTQHNDNQRSGANLNETILNTSNVNVNQFGLLASRQVTGQIYAQPLYVPAVAGAGGRNLVIVATMENRVYAFDADDLSNNANPVWQRQVDPHPVAPALFNRSTGFPLTSRRAWSEPTRTSALLPAQVGSAPTWTS